MVLLYFNSIKVRLERASSMLSKDELLFQFHKGAIRTPEPDQRTWSAERFQFHKGAIRTFAVAENNAVDTISIP